MPIHVPLKTAEDAKSMVVRVADNNFADVPYAAIDKLSYQYSKKHQVTEGALVMVAWIPAAAKRETGVEVENMADALH